MKIGYVHAREDQKIGQDPNFHEPWSSNGKDQSGQRKADFSPPKESTKNAPRIRKNEKYQAFLYFKLGRTGQEPTFCENRTFGG